MPEFIPVILESPFAGDRARNKAYLQLCIRDCILRKETPYASHQMLTEALDDSDPEQRAVGIEAGWSMRAVIKRAVFYLDFGWSGGMLAAKELYDAEKFPYEERRIYG